MNKDHFADLVNSYHASEITDEKWHSNDEKVEKWIKTPGTPNQNAPNKVFILWYIISVMIKESKHIEMDL